MTDRVEDVILGQSRLVMGKKPGGGYAPLAVADSGALLGAAAASTAYSYIAAASANQDSQVVKAAAGALRGLSLHNVSAALRYVKVYNKATAPTSADVPVLRFPLAALGGGIAREFNGGIPFGAGLGFRITTGGADSDATAATAGDVQINLEYE